jgi:hypothetical protein
MADYMYHCYVYHETDGVMGIVPANEDANNTDWETNYKSQALEVNDIIPAATTFELIKTWTQFKALIVSPYTWSDVKYAHESNAWDIYLITSTQA